MVITRSSSSKIKSSSSKRRRIDVNADGDLDLDGFTSEIGTESSSSFGFSTNGRNTTSAATTTTSSSRSSTAGTTSKIKGKGVANTMLCRRNFISACNDAIPDSEDEDEDNITESRITPRKRSLKGGPFEGEEELEMGEYNLGARDSQVNTGSASGTITVEIRSLGKVNGKVVGDNEGEALSGTLRTIPNSEAEENDLDNIFDTSESEYLSDPSSTLLSESSTGSNCEIGPTMEDGADDAEVVSAPVPVSQLAQTRPEPRRRARPRERLTRAEKSRNDLWAFHPELQTIWDDLDNRPKIPTEMDPQPAGLSLTMLPFQREGLHWMRCQEETNFRGGILADEMGMGKTIQTLSLIMSQIGSKPNLVLAPTVALRQWASEIEKYTGDALKVATYHGAGREQDPEELAKYDVILTTYSVMESVWRKQTSGFKRKAGVVKEDSALHSIKYHRVILDEAHNIKDRSCGTAKAVFALQTKYKMCLSGTPIQNRIGELFSLLRFLKADPFSYYFCRRCSCKSLHWKFTDMRSCDGCGHGPMSHMCFFNNSLLKPILRNGNTGEGKEAFTRLHKLLDHIMLRRTKLEKADDLGLPPKSIKVRRCYFTEAELDLYDSVYSDSKRKFDTYVAQGVVLNNYANIFTLITRMRQLADHPDLVLRKNSEPGQNTPVCCLCDDEAEEAIKSRCHHIFCRLCVQEYMGGFIGEDLECPKCHITLNIDLTQPAIEVDHELFKKNSIINRINMSNWRSSTKIECLVEALLNLRSNSHTIKSLVFSQFTSMLQLVEWRLKRAGFKTAMLEGSMSPTQREATINHFMQDPEVTVFLVSLKAGGIALNLIEASQVFMLDPWWNPSVESQAMDRIHRIGQTRACKVIKLIVENSIESRILELQEKKSQMVNATIGGDHREMDKLTPADMQFLFQN